MIRLNSYIRSIALKLTLVLIPFLFQISSANNPNPPNPNSLNGQCSDKLQPACDSATQCNWDSNSSTCSHRHADPANYDVNEYSYHQTSSTLFQEDRANSPNASYDGDLNDIALYFNCIFEVLDSSNEIQRIKCQSNIMGIGLIDNAETVINELSTSVTIYSLDGNSNSGNPFSEDTDRTTLSSKSDLMPCNAADNYVNVSANPGSFSQGNTFIFEIAAPTDSNGQPYTFDPGDPNSITLNQIISREISFYNHTQQTYLEDHTPSYQYGRANRVVASADSTFAPEGENFISNLVSGAVSVDDNGAVICFDENSSDPNCSGPPCSQSWSESCAQALNNLVADQDISTYNNSPNKNFLMSHQNRGGKEYDPISIAFISDIHMGSKQRST